MPRKDFQSHLKEIQDGPLPTNIKSIAHGIDDGTFTVTYQDENSKEIRVQAQASDVGDYPRSHSFFIYTDSNDLPRAVFSALQDISILCEMTISQTVREIAGRLNDAAWERDSSNDLEMEENVSGTDDLDEGFCPIDDEDMQDEDYAMCFTEPIPGCDRLSRGPSVQGMQCGQDEHDKLSLKVRNDVEVARKAGFRVSHHGDILRPGAQCYLMLSIRVSKLKIQEDTRQAWHLLQEDYIMLVLKYYYGYRSLKSLKNSTNGQQYLMLSLLVTKKHKLSSSELIDALDSIKQVGDETKIAEEINHTELPSRPLFIGPALNEMLNTRLLTLISYRLSNSLSWTAAMQYYNDQQGALAAHAADMTSYRTMEDTSRIKDLPDIISADQIEDARPITEDAVSIPCAAMQLALRHIVRCTEFCLVCFANTKDDFEALKPYVCSNPLCLYQYMSMGLGPGIEFEVLSQPHVVDLLVSLCHSGAQAGGLRELPLGLGLQVPNPRLLPRYSLLALPQTPFCHPIGSPVPTHNNDEVPSQGLRFRAQWNEKLRELRFSKQSSLAQEAYMHEGMVKIGDWLTFWPKDEKLCHCKIIAGSYPVYRYESLVQSYLPARGDCQPNLDSQRVTDRLKYTFAPDIFRDVQIVPYAMLFDDLEEYCKPVALRMLLDTLPSISEMAEYLRTERGSRSQLIKFTEKIIPAALAILRWIVASNRSCLIYTGDAPQEEFIYGMPGYIQFKFASGAPDKESRFLKNVNDVGARLKTAHPTIFAWHGSPLRNWHSIVRQGLDFKDVVNGRAYGNGVYHALDARTSLSYSGLGYEKWPGSKLDIQTVLSLNEIVNAPAEFRHASPYLVIQHIDWIQTRYLFVKSGKAELATDQEMPQYILPQDLKYFPTGDDNKKALVIPTCAISKSRRRALKDERHHEARSNHKSALEFQNGDTTVYVSDESEVEDDILFKDKSQTNQVPIMKPAQINNKIKTAGSITAFEPGSLDRSKLPMLAAPTYATTSSSKALQRELKSMLKEQQETPLHELGWFLDPIHIDNPYQWIVELHSFDTDLPLAKDMKSRNITSIVLEMRFGPNFNFSPPFVRVIRPRFLPFLKGGGGHVTAGGALCMQLLTSDGWNPSSTMSAVLLQVRMAVTSLDPTPARLEPTKGTGEYGVGEAIQAFTRACYTHGWAISDDFDSMASMTPAASQEDEQSVSETIGANKKQKRE